MHGVALASAGRPTTRTRPRARSLRARDAQGGARPGPSCQSSRSRMASDTGGCHRWLPAHAEGSSCIWPSPRSWNVLGRHSGQRPTVPAVVMAHAVCGEQEGPALIGGDGRGPFAVPGLRPRRRSVGTDDGLQPGCGCASWCRPRPERTWTRSQSWFAIHSPRPRSSCHSGTRRPDHRVGDAAWAAHLEHQSLVLLPDAQLGLPAAVDQRVDDRSRALPGRARRCDPVTQPGGEGMGDDVRPAPRPGRRGSRPGARPRPRPRAGPPRTWLPHGGRRRRTCCHCVAPPRRRPGGDRWASPTTSAVRASTS